MTATPDPALLHAFADTFTGPLGETEFVRLYEANSRAIFGYVLATTGRRDVAEDVVQEIFCRVLAEKHAARLTAMEANEARRYLFRVASNLLRDRWRGGEDTPSPELDDTLTGANYETNLDTGVHVRAVLAQLKPRQRELLWLAYVEGMDHAEIAEATGLARLSIRILLFRARNEAKTLLNATRTSR